MIKKEDFHPSIIKKHEKKFFSQYGEDGVIDYLFSLIPPKYKEYVEFGAGELYDNTIYLEKEK